MAFNPFKKGDWDKLGKQTKNEFSKIERALRDVGEDVKRELRKLGADCRNGVRAMGREMEDGLKKSANEMKGGLQQAGGEIRNGVLVAGEEAKKGIYSAGEVNDYIARTKRPFEEELPALTEKVFKETADAFEKELPVILEKVLSDLVSEGIKPALKAQAKVARGFANGMDHVAEKSPALVDEINKVGFDVELKVNIQLNLEYQNFWTRAREVAGILDRYGNDGIVLRRRDIRGFITALGPDTISFGGGASFSLGLDIGGVAKAKSISLALFIELADYIMEEMGVPE